MDTPDISIRNGPFGIEFTEESQYVRLFIQLEDESWVLLCSIEKKDLPLLENLFYEAHFRDLVFTTLKQVLSDYLPK